MQQRERLTLLLFLELQEKRKTKKMRKEEEAIKLVSTGAMEKMEKEQFVFSGG